MNGREEVLEFKIPILIPKLRDQIPNSRT